MCAGWITLILILKFNFPVLFSNVSPSEVRCCRYFKNPSGIENVRGFTRSLGFNRNAWSVVLRMRVEQLHTH